MERSNILSLQVLYGSLWTMSLCLPVSEVSPMQPEAKMTPNTAAASSSSTPLVLGSRLCITAHKKQCKTTFTPELSNDIYSHYTNLGFIHRTFIFVVRNVSLLACRLSGSLLSFKKVNSTWPEWHCPSENTWFNFTPKLRFIHIQLIVDVFAWGSKTLFVF